MSNECQVNIGLRQGSALSLSPLLFILVMELISRKIRKVTTYALARKLKGKVLDSCEVPASSYGLETLALSELNCININYKYVGTTG